MKTSRVIEVAGLFTLALAFTALAQGPQGCKPGNQQEGMRLPPPPAEELTAGMIVQFDSDGDGKLDEAELKNALSTPPQPPTAEVIAVKWVEEFDTDGNGQLSAEELAKALEANRPPKGPDGRGGKGQMEGPGAPGAPGIPGAPCGHRNGCGFRGGPERPIGPPSGAPGPQDQMPPPRNPPDDGGEQPGEE